MRARVRDRDGVAEGRGDEDAAVAVLPQPDDGHVDRRDDGRDVVQALHADGGRAPATTARAICAVVRGSRRGSPG